jgi:putative transposase
MLKVAYITKEMQVALGVTVKSVHARAKRENWQSRPREGRGGGHEWLTESMPEDTRLAIRLHFESKTMAEVKQAKPTAPTTIELPALPEDIAEKKLAEGAARMDLLRFYLEWLRSKGRSVAKKDAFITAYHGGAWPSIYRLVGRTSWKSIERWKKTRRDTKSPTALVDRRGLAHRGKTILTEQHVNIILGQVLNPNAPNISECVRQVHARCEAVGIFAPSYATVDRFQKKFFQECFNEWVYFREGKKAWNDKAAISVLRDWSLVEVGDIVVADGHVLNFETIHPATGKPKRMTLLLFYDGRSNMPLGWEIMPTENVACISAAFRRTCLFLGKIPLLVYIDNGRAFRAKFFKGCPDLNQAGIFGLYEALGCHVTHAWAYHGQSKPIERFFSTMHDMEVMVPSFVGTCIADKPARLHRGEDKHRALYEKMGGRPLTLEETHRLVAKWFDEYSKRASRAVHLDGRTPREVFREGKGPGLTEEQLRTMDVLMMSSEIKSITKDGISLNGRLYWAQALQSRRHKLIVRYDEISTPHSVLCYAPDGRFICEALDRKHYKIAHGIHPAAKHLGTEDHLLDLEGAIALKRRQEREATGRFDMLLNATILPETKARQAALEAKIKPGAVAPDLVKPEPVKVQTDEEFETEMAVQAAIRAEDALKAQTKTLKEEDYYEPRTITAEEQFWSDVDREFKEADKYELILEAEAQDMEIPEKYKGFCKFYEQTEEYARLKDYFEERRMMHAMTYFRRGSQTAVAQ